MKHFKDIMRKIQEVKCKLFIAITIFNMAFADVAYAKTGEVDFKNTTLFKGSVAVLTGLSKALMGTGDGSACYCKRNPVANGR